MRRWRSSAIPDHLRGIAGGGPCYSVFNHLREFGGARFAQLHEGRKEARPVA